ncbi:MAG: NapC/NirT family cytochrome c [Rubrivivax sp.]
MAEQDKRSGGFFKGLAGKLWALATGGLGVAFVLGIIFWGGFNTAMEWTNREAFCISCHEMRDNVYVEYRNTVHYQNRTGVRATCPDCHVPKEWVPKIIRKIQASNEVFHKVLGSIDTPEKFNAKRAELAGHEWARMKKNDSQECRNCHNFTFMDYAEQNRRAATRHQTAFNEGQTCIDCHKGIAHTLPGIEQNIGAPKADAAELPPSRPEKAEKAASN